MKLDTNMKTELQVNRHRNQIRMQLAYVVTDVELIQDVRAIDVANEESL